LLTAFLNNFLIGLELLLHNRLILRLGIALSLLFFKFLLFLSSLRLNLIAAFCEINLDLGCANKGVVEVSLCFYSFFRILEADEAESAVFSVFYGDFTVGNSADFTESLGEFLGVKSLGDIFDDKATHQQHAANNNNSKL
jgi:hypothetical protein